MSKYDGLGDHLRKQTFAEIPMTFADIEKVTGTKLPPKAQHHRAWWSNNPSNNVMTKVWLNAGYETAQVDMAARKLLFKRMKKTTPPPGGMAEGAREFKPAEGGKKPRRSPLFGALKGTFTIAPGWDLTQPALDPDELAEWEASLDRKADLYEKGLSGKDK
ncbi:MAG TPA: hypothetical protein VGC27_09115 [Rhizomicrobium sp.]